MRLLQLVVPLLLLAGLGWWFGLQPLGRTLAHAAPGGLVVYAAVTAVVLAGYAARWRMAARAMGAGAPLGRLMAARLAGDAVGSVVPSARLAGEPLRIALARGPANPTAVATAGVAIDRLFEVIGNMLAVIVYVSVFAVTHGATAPQRVPVALAGLMVLLLLAVAGLLYRLRAGGRPLAPLYGARAKTWAPRLSARLERLRRVEDHLIRFVRERPGTVMLGVVASLLIEAGCVFQYHALLGAFGIALDLPTLLLVLLGSGVARAAPAPAGLGVLEAAQVAVVGASAGRPDLGFVVGVILRLHETLLLGLGLLVLSHQGLSLARLRAAARAGA